MATLSSTLQSLQSLVSEEFECPICLQYCTDTHLNPDCNHRFCGICIKKCIRKCNHECPTCRERIPTYRQLRRDGQFDRILHRLLDEVIHPLERQITLEAQAQKNKKKRHAVEDMNFGNIDSTNISGICKSKNEINFDSQEIQDRTIRLAVFNFTMLYTLAHQLSLQQSTFTEISPPFTPFKPPEPPSELIFRIIRASPCTESTEKPENSKSKDRELTISSKSNHMKLQQQNTSMMMMNAEEMRGIGARYQDTKRNNRLGVNPTQQLSPPSKKRLLSVSQQHPVPKKSKLRMKIKRKNSLDEQLSGSLSGLHDKKWNAMFECLLLFIDGEREIQTRNMSDHDAMSWKWSGNVPTDYKAKSGETLGTWIRNQRFAKNNGSLKPEREQRLASIGLNWRYCSWNTMLKQLRVYVEREKRDGQKWDGNVTTNLKSNQSDGDVKHTELGHWVRTQRDLYQAGKLSFDRRRQLESIGLRWVVLLKIPWHTMYEALCKYADLKRKASENHYWDGNVSPSYETEDQPPLKLGQWVIRQRIAYSQNLLNRKFVINLEEIGLKWNVIGPKESIQRKVLHVHQRPPVHQIERQSPLHVKHSISPMSEDKEKPPFTSLITEERQLQEEKTQGCTDLVRRANDKYDINRLAERHQPKEGGTKLTKSSCNITISSLTKVLSHSEGVSSEYISSVHPVDNAAYKARSSDVNQSHDRKIEAVYNKHQNSNSDQRNDEEAKQGCMVRVHDDYNPNPCTIV